MRRVRLRDNLRRVVRRVRRRDDRRRVVRLRLQVLFSHIVADPVGDMLVVVVI